MKQKVIVVLIIPTVNEPAATNHLGRHSVCFASQIPYFEIDRSIKSCLGYKPL